MTTIDLASCLAAIPDRRRAEGKDLRPGRRHPVFDHRNAERRSVVSPNPRPDPREALRAQCGFSGERRAATSASLHLRARNPRRTRSERTRAGVSSSCGKSRRFLRRRAVPLHRHRRKDVAAKLRRFRRPQGRTCAQRLRRRPSDHSRA